MIKLVCPNCGKSSDRVQTKLIIKSSGYIRIVPSRETGVERAVASPIRIEDRQAKVNIVPDSTYICGRCGQETQISEWKYIVRCDHCGTSITSRAVKNPSGIIDRCICRDTMNNYCSGCWSQLEKEYCPDCRFNETCILYNNS